MTFQPDLKLREVVLHPFNTYIDAQGYVMLNRTDRKQAPIKEHILIAEIMFGGPLPKGHDVHHLDHNRTNNNPLNLMVCSHSYHMITHRWDRAKKACGNSHWRKCLHCKQWDDPQNLFISNNSDNIYHRICQASYERERYRNNPEIRRKKIEADKRRKSN